MTCYKPLKGFLLGTKPNGKKDLKITSNKVNHLESNGNDNWIPAYHQARSINYNKAIYDFIDIPCGRCIGCRLDKSREWASRCMFELQYHDSSYFVTLTYDDEHVHHREYIDEDGTFQDVLTCSKRDFQLFMKRLRKAFPDQSIRYFACTEYGENTARPHAHAILFGLSLDDLEPLFTSDLGDALYTSKKLESIWQNGLVSIGAVTFESCAYVSRYVTKKQYGQNAEVYKKYNIEPESALMSLKPAIGRQYYEDNPHKLFTYEKNFISTPKGGRSVTAPRYFKKLYEADFPELYERYHDKNVDNGENRKKLLCELSDKDYYDILLTENNVLEEKSKILLRNDI